MTIRELIRRAEQSRDDAIRKRKNTTNEAEELLRQMQATRARGERVDQADVDRCSALADRRSELTGKIDELVRQIGDLREQQADDDRVLELAQQSNPTQAARSLTESSQERTMTTIRVSESRTYQPHQAAQLRSSGGSGFSFLTDLYRSQILGDPTAGERLARHGEEVRSEQPGMYERAINSGGVGAFVPPQYLVELWAEYARAGRPVADLCNTSVPLPEEGMTIPIPRITTASAVGVQASENAALTNTDADETTLSVPVVTIGGYTDISRQAIERGVLVESILFSDLAADYNAKQDAQILNGSGASGQHLGILNVGSINLITYTDASPTPGELWPKLADAAGRVMSNRFTGPTALVMRPNAWAWMLSALDSTGRPVINAGESGPHNAIGTVDQMQYPGAVGRLLGLPVYLSGNVPNNLGAGTNETRIIAADFRDLFLLEQDGGIPTQLRFDESLSSTLGVRLVAYGYSAFASGRQPSAISVVAGTGLIVPAL